MLATLGNGKEFKFNFPVDELRQLELNTTGNGHGTIEVKDDDKKRTDDNKIVKPITFAPTDNTFRFNFDVTELKSE